MKNKDLQDLTAMSLFSTFGILLYIWLIPGYIRVLSWDTGAAFDSRSFPKLIAAVIILVGLLGIIRSVSRLLIERSKRNKTDVSEKPASINFLVYIMPVVIFAIILGYYFLFSKFGFIISTLIAVPVLLIALKCRKWQYYLYVYMFSGIIYAIFRYVLLIWLP